ncbi:hypothetical protein FRC07_001333 [Ceratobasidium sp. 392]|nr:hypothetical protein FRC07_001333 [Ceratobasidium sp. 392]
MAQPVLQQDECYFLICPDPADCPEGLTDAGGKYFFIKFGDGDWEAPGRYSTHVPTVRGFRNRTCAVAAYYDNTIGGVRAGTYLKNAVSVNGLGLARGRNGGATEWHKIRPAGRPIDLSQDLISIGTNFTTAELGFNAATARPNDANRRQTASWALAAAAVAIRQRIQQLGHHA